MAEPIFQELAPRAALATAIDRLVPPERPQLVTGIKRQGYRLVFPQRDDYKGIAVIDGGAAADTVRFQTEVLDAAVDLSRSFVSYSFTVEVFEGTPGAWYNVNRDYPVSVRNGAGSLLFQRCTTSVNNTIIDDDAAAAGENGGIAFSGFIQALTREKQGFGMGGPLRYWAPVPIAAGGGETGDAAVINDTTANAAQMVSAMGGHSVGGLDEFWALADDVRAADGNALRVNAGENTVHVCGASRGRGAAPLTDGNTVVVAFRPTTGLWRQGTALPPGCRLDLFLHRDRAQRFIQSQFDAAAAADRISGTRVTAVDCTLWLYEIQPQDDVRAAIDAALAAAKFFLPFAAQRIYSQQIAVGTTSLRLSGLFPGNVPTRVYCWFTRALASSYITAGQSARCSPFAISPIGWHMATAPGADPMTHVEDGIPVIQTARAQVNGRDYPDEGYDLALSSDELRRYAQYRNACSDPAAPVLGLEQWRNIYPVLVIDINPATAGVAPEDIADEVGPSIPYSANGLELQLGLLGATVATTDDLPLHLVVLAEHPAGVALRGSSATQIALQRVAY